MFLFVSVSFLEREPWKAGSLGGKSRSQLLRKSWDKTTRSGSDGLGGSSGGGGGEGMEMVGKHGQSSLRVARFSANTTLEELE